MTDPDGPRLATPAEFSEMMALLDRYFANERGGMASRLPFAYDPDHSDYHAIIVEDGRIVSHVAAIPQTLSIGRGTIESWGIGGVATDRRYRGNGYMSQLLEFWFERMDERGIPLSDLSGNRQRYANFGYELAGSEYRYTLETRSFDGAPSASDAVFGYDSSERYLEMLHQLHETEPYRVDRDQSGSQTVFGQRGLETLVYDGDDGPAYISLTRESRARTIKEFGGSDTGLETLLSHVLAVFDLTELTARVPPWHPLEPVFARHSRSWSSRPHRKLRICSLSGLLEAFRGQLEECWLQSGRSEWGSVELGISGGESVRISYGPDGVSVEPTAEHAHNTFDRTTLTSLLFGLPDRCADVRAGDPFLETALPLRFYFWPTEHV